MVLTGWLVLHAAAGRAQTSVELGGWVLPEGTAITGTGDFESETVVQRSDEAAPFRFVADIQIGVHYIVLAVDEGLQCVRETVVAFSGTDEMWEGDEWVGVRDANYPFLERPLLVERDSLRWRFTLEEGEPTPEEAEILAPATRFDLDPSVFPDTPVGVGDTWTVPREVLEAQHGLLDLERPQRMTFRLDSIGVYEAHPAAFLSYTLDVTSSSEPGEVTRQQEAGRRVHLLDQRFDAYVTALRTEHISYQATDEIDGTFASESHRQTGYEVWRWATVPEDP